MHVRIVGHGSDADKGKSYKIRMMKTKCIITRTRRQVKATPISVKDYLSEEMSKANRPQAYDNLSKLIDYFALPNQHDHLSNLEIEGTYVMPKSTQPSKHTRIDQQGDIKQSSNRQKPEEQVRPQNANT